MRSATRKRVSSGAGRRCSTVASGGPRGCRWALGGGCTFCGYVNDSFIRKIEPSELVDGETGAAFCLWLSPGLVQLLAALFLPLHINGVLGDPDPAAPIAWLLGTLALSVGAPFAVLSATAPLLQAWFARVRAGYPDGRNPYVLYAASNLGSFLALLSYPAVIEPLTTLTSQMLGWSGGYAAFTLMVAALAIIVWRRRLDPARRAPSCPPLCSSARRTPRQHHRRG